MKKLLPLLSLVLLVLSLMPLTKATARQSEAPYIVDATMPVDPGVKASVEAWLGTSAPVPLTYWAITYVEPRGYETVLSLAALEIDAPNDPWSVADNNTVAWMGTVIVHVDTSVEMYSSTPELKTLETSFSVKALAALALGPGGGSHLSFPWKQGSTMMYGPRGVHDAGGGGWYADGFDAVDFVGGDDMGSGVAKNSIYAVDPGVVDYVCADDNTTLVRTYNETTDEYYIYAHLLDNNNLALDHEFADKALIGKVKYGSFDDNCGWADQQDDHYHLHFGFQRNNGTFRMENCILNGAKWKCGTKTVAPGQFLLGGGGTGNSGGGSGTGGGGSGTGDDGGYAIDQPSFWDYVVVGVVTMWDKMVLKNMPDHTPLQYTDVLYSTVKLVIKITRVMIYSNVDLGPLFACVILGLTIKALFGIAEFVMFLFKAWKSLVPVLGA